jgi:hypothetical protein
MLLSLIQYLFYRAQYIFMKDIWYKNPWVWLIIAFPLSSIFAGIATVIITNKHQPEMVIDDYYKKGKAINMELGLYQQAKQLGIELQLLVQDERVIIKSNTDFPALKATFTHSTQSKRDFDAMLTKNAKGEFTTLLEQPISGKWSVIISPVTAEWKLRKEIGLPSTTWVTLN